ELRELSGAGHRGAVDQLRREDLGVPVLANVQVHHEIEKRAFEPGAGALQKDKARPGDLDGALEIDDAQALGDFIMWPHLEGRWFAPLDPPGTDGHVAAGIFPFRNRVVRRVGDLEQQGTQPGVDGRNLLFERLDLIAHAAQLLDRRLVAALRHCGRPPVLLRLELLQFGARVAALGVEADGLIARRLLALLARSLFDEVRMLANEVKAQHGGHAGWGTGSRRGWRAGP